MTLLHQAKRLYMRLVVRVQRRERARMKRQLQERTLIRDKRLDHFEMAKKSRF
jgi:hypothetical protein